MGVSSGGFKGFIRSGVVQYLKAIELYRWCEERKVKNIGSESVLLAYFGEHTRQKKPSTLWAMYSMIRTMLEIEEKTDISKHGKLLAFLKRQNLGLRPKKSNVFSRKNIEDFLNEAPNNLLSIKLLGFIGLLIGMGLYNNVPVGSWCNKIINKLRYGNVPEETIQNHTADEKEQP